MKSLVIIFATTIVVRAYRDGRAITSYGSDFMAYHGTRQPAGFHDETLRQSPGEMVYRYPYRAQQFSRDLSSFKDQSSFKEQPSYKVSNTFGRDYPLRDEQFYGDNWPYRGEWPYKKRFSLRDPLFTGDTSSSKGQSFYKDQSSDYKDRLAYRGSWFADELPSSREHSFFKDQSLPKDHHALDDRPTYPENLGNPMTTDSYRQQSPDNLMDLYRQQQQAAFDDKAQNFVTAMTTSSYREQSSPKPTDPYNQRQRQNQSYQSESQDFSSFTPTKDPRLTDEKTNSYTEQGQQTREPLSFGGHSNYLKYGNHGLGFASVPAVSSFGNALPVETETSTSATTPLAAGNLKASVASTAATNAAEVRLTATPTPKIADTSTTLQPNIQQHTMNLLETRSTPSGLTGPTMSPGPVTPKQSADASPMPGVPLMATAGPMTSFDQNVHFHTMAPTSSPFYMANNLKNSLQGPLTNYLMSTDEAKNNLKTEIQRTLLNYQLLSNDLKDSYKPNIQGSMLNYILPEEQKHDFQSNLQGAVMNYLLPEVAKQSFKSPVQSAVFNYLLPDDGKRGAISFAHSTRPETLGYVQLAIAERPKFSLPTNIPIATTLSAVSRPAETINYLPTTLPRIGFAGHDASANLPIGSGSAFQLPRAATLPASLSLSIPNRLQSNGIHGIITPSVSGGMSASIPAGISTNIPASMPTLNFGQSFQHDAGQLRQFGEPRTSSFPSGLQLQLGGFGGINYMPSSSNSLGRQMDLGMAKVGFRLPDFQRSSVPTFDKIGFGQHLWPLTS